MLAAGLPCGLPDCQVLFNLRTPAPGPRAPWPRLGRRAAGGRAASDLPGCLRLRSCGIQGGSRRGLELVRLVVRRVLALPKNKGVSTRTAPPPGGTEKGSACRSTGIGLIGIVHATLLDEFMNVVQKERAKFQVLSRNKPQ